MPDAITEPTTETTATGDAQGDPADLGDAGKKALTAEREARKAAEKAAAEALARIKEFEDAQKSEAEKAADALRTAQETATQSAAKALRYEVAAEKGLPLEAAARLTGSTREELLADADVLKTLIGNAPAPRPDLTQASARGSAAATGPEAEFAQFLKGQIG